MTTHAADQPAHRHPLPELTTLRFEREPASSVATIVLDRPDRLNAVSVRLMEDMIELCRWIDRQHDIKVVVVRGEGRAFCAGFDLADFNGVYGGSDTRATIDLGRRMTEELTDLRPLTIAALHGHCVGGGLVLAAACDLRIAAHDARFSIPEVDLGVPLAWGGVPRLVREVGPALAKELILTCRPFDAAEAHAARFLNRVVPADELLTAASALAHDLANKPMFAITTIKTQVNAVMEEIAGTGRNANDADTMFVALNDPESRAASARYLESRARR